MFNNGYGIVNYLGVDLLHLYEQAPLWFDNPGSSFVLVVIFAIWRYFPYAFISFLAILQTIDKSLYEAAEMDGANAWQRFRIVTLPAIMPVLATVVTLRTIWMFYMFADVYLLTTKVDILGVYLYKTAFAFNDLGKAAAISVVLFIIIFAVILLTETGEPQWQQINAHSVVSVFTAGWRCFSSSRCFRFCDADDLVQERKRGDLAASYAAAATVDAGALCRHF